MNHIDNYNFFNKFNACSILFKSPPFKFDNFNMLIIYYDIILYYIYIFL